MIRLINIDKKNYKNILKLDPGSDNKQYIDDISECILEYLFYRKSVVKAINLNNITIGFVMIEDKHNNKWIRQLLIDKKFQNQGYGTIALKLIIRYIQKKYYSKKIFLSTNNSKAVSLYIKFGFYKIEDDNLTKYYKEKYSEDIYNLDLTKFDYAKIDLHKNEHSKNQHRDNQSIEIDTSKIEFTRNGRNIKMNVVQL